jgi:hypothetical protein
MNIEKTEKIKLIRENKKEDEKWRQSKKLGTLLGDIEEMKRRKQLAAAAFGKLKRIWSEKNNKISPERRIKLYNAYFMPILTYNASTWALSETETEELEAYHRKQLRTVLGIKYPRKIPNSKLYNTTNTVELKHVIRRARWRMFGHTLRMSNKTPAKLAMMQYFSSTNTDCFIGRPRTTLPGILDKDISLAQKQQKANSPLQLLPKQLKTAEDFQEIEKLARNRSLWRSIVANMYVLEPPKPILRPRRHAKQ